MWPAAIKAVGVHTRSEKDILYFSQQGMINLNLNFSHVHAHKLLNEILLFRLNVGCRDPLMVCCFGASEVVFRDVLFSLNRVECHENVEDEKFISLLRSFILIEREEVFSLLVQVAEAAGDEHAVGGVQLSVVTDHNGLGAVS